MNLEEGYNCEICNKSFSRKSKLSNHIRCHIEPKEEELDEYLKEEVYSDQEEEVYADQKVLKNSTDFEVLPKIESDCEISSCSHCQKTFGRNDLLCHHIVLCHPDEALKCKVCSKVFLTQAKYQTHYSEHLLGISNEKPLELPHNGSESTDKEGELGSYKCQICMKAFSCYTNLWSHAWVHTDEKPYVCKVCGRGFGRLYRLRYHMAFHTSNRPYECQVCGKSFKLIVFLKTHQKAVHGGVVLQRSEKWSKSFSVQSKSISKVKSSDSKRRSRKCKTKNKKTTLINQIFKPIATKMVIESKKVHTVSKKKVICRDNLKSKISDGTRSYLKTMPSRPKKVCKKTSLSIASTSGLFDGANTRKKDPESHCVDKYNFDYVEDFEFERSAMHFTSLVSTKTIRKVGRTSSRIKKLKRVHFNAATENIKFIFNNESSVIESELPKASISQPTREYKILPVKSTSHLKSNSEKLTLTKENYVKDSEIPLHAHDQMNKENVRKLSIVGKNTQAKSSPKKRKLMNLTKEGCRQDKVMSLFICKVCNKTYKHKTSLTRHLRESAHDPCMFSNADLLEEVIISETKDSENLEKKRWMDKVTPRNLLPQPETKCIKTMPNMKLNKCLQNNFEKPFYGAPSTGENKVETPLNFSLKKSDLPRKNLFGKTKPCVKGKNERPKQACKKVSFLIDSQDVKHPKETIETVPSKQVMKSSKNISVEHVRNYDKGVMEARHKSKENVNGKNLMTLMDDSEKDAYLNFDRMNNSTGVSKAIVSELCSENCYNDSEEKQRDRIEFVGHSLKTCGEIDCKDPIDNKTPSIVQGDYSSRKSSRVDGAMEFHMKSKMQTSPQKQIADCSVLQVSSAEHQCEKCLRKFKHAYSLKRHCLMQVCTGGGKKVFSSKLHSPEERMLPFLPQELPQTGRPLITTKHCKTTADGLLKLENNCKPRLCNKGNEASFMRDQLKKIHSSLLTETNKNALPKHNKKALKLMGKLGANRRTSTSPLVKTLPMKPYKCYRCDKSYVSLSFFEKHLNKNSCSSSYKCFFCRKKFTDKSVWEQHVKLEKAVIQNKSLSCAGCMTIFCRPGDLVRHIMRNTCSRCNVECFCGYFLDLHEKSSECNFGSPGVPLGKCGCLPGIGNCQLCCKRNDDPNESSILHHNDIPYSNSIILKDANDSNTSFDKEAELANDALRKAIPSMFQLSFTEGNHDYALPGTAEDREEITRNNNVSQRGLQNDYLGDNSGKFIVNYTGSEVGTDIFQGGNSRIGNIYETGYFEPDAMTFLDNLQGTRISDIDWPVPQLTNQHSHGYYSQFINYHYYNYSSQFQGQATERGRNAPDKNGKKMSEVDKLHLESHEYGRTDTSQESFRSAYSSGEQQYSDMSMNVVENPSNVSSQFKIFESGDWESHSLSDNSHTVCIPVHDATVYEIEGFRGNGEAHSYENMAGNSTLPNMFDNHQFSSIAFPNSSQFTR